MNPATGRMRIRMVDIESDRYKIARSYMLRLKRSDFDDPVELAKLAAVVHVTPEKFRAEFEALVGSESTRSSLMMPSASRASTS